MNTTTLKTQHRGQDLHITKTDSDSSGTAFYTATSEVFCSTLDLDDADFSKAASQRAYRTAAEAHKAEAATIDDIFDGSGYESEAARNDFYDILTAASARLATSLADNLQTSRNEAKKDARRKAAKEFREAGKKHFSDAEKEERAQQIFNASLALLFDDLLKTAAGSPAAKARTDAIAKF